MEEKFKDRMIHLGNKILTSSRNELYLSMRFLDIALNSLSYEIYLSTITIGTDGEKILYNPNYLIRRYQDDPVLVNRTYLHMLLHCIFRHMINEEERDLEYWNLSCDIAVESIMDGLDYKCINLTVSDARNETYETLRTELKVLTAEGIYYVLKKRNLSYRELKQMEKEFVSCDHSIWSRLKESMRDEEKEGAKEKDNQKDSKGRNQEESKESNEEHENDSSKNKDDKTEKNSKEKEKQKRNPSLLNNSPRTKEKEEEVNKNWKDISEKVQSNIEAMAGQVGDEAGGLIQSLNVENRERYDYKDFFT
jgi:hypothetical protein